VPLPTITKDDTPLTVLVIAITHVALSLFEQIHTRAQTAFKSKRRWSRGYLFRCICIYCTNMHSYLNAAVLLCLWNIEILPVDLNEEQ